MSNSNVLIKNVVNWRPKASNSSNLPSMPECMSLCYNHKIAGSLYYNIKITVSLYYNLKIEKSLFIES